MTPGTATDPVPVRDRVLRPLWRHREDLPRSRYTEIQWRIRGHHPRSRQRAPGPNHRKTSNSMH